MRYLFNPFTNDVMIMIETVRVEVVLVGDVLPE